MTMNKVGGTAQVFGFVLAPPRPTYLANGYAREVKLYRHIHTSHFESNAMETVD